jgi:hypothetical protein
VSANCGPFEVRSPLLPPAPPHHADAGDILPDLQGRSGEEEMTATGVTPFRKTAACPSETILILYRTKRLSQDLLSLVKVHLDSCDFCSAETALLGYYSLPQRGECKAPEIPINLRVLAESLLHQGRKIQLDVVPRSKNDRRKVVQKRK